MSQPICAEERLLTEEQAEFVRRTFVESQAAYERTLRQHGLFTVVVDLLIGYYEGGDDDFCFYDSTSGNLMSGWADNLSRIAFKNHPSNPPGRFVDKWHRRCRVHFAAHPASNTIKVVYVSKKSYTLSDLQSVAGWSTKINPVNVDNFQLLIV